MTGGNPWAVLLVAEDTPYSEVQRVFHRRVKQTHPDHGGEAAEFAVVMDAFARVSRDSALRGRRNTRRPTPYDHWLEPSRPGRSWTEGRRPFGAVSGSAGPVGTPAGVSAVNEFTAVLAAEMAKSNAAAAPACV